jgi:hypothetical protein
MMSSRPRRPTLYRDHRFGGVARWVVGDPAKLLMRIPDGLLDQPVFLAVERGGSFLLAGTGFLFSMKSEEYDAWPHLYLITARHCVEKAERYGGLSLRLNKRAGGTEFVRLDGSWYFPDSAADDVAVMPLPILMHNHFDLAPSDMSNWAATDEYLESESVGVGDEVVVIGLFTHRGGKHQNRPIVRTGIISAMPVEPLVDPNSALEYDAYLIECRSIGGFSGSPVYLVLPPGRVRQDKEEFEMHRRDFKTLGLVRGHWDKRFEEFADLGETEIDQLNTGIAIVTPIQKAVEVITNTEELVKQRKEFEEENIESLTSTEDSADPTSDEETTGDEFGRFEKLTRRLVGVPKKELDEKRRQDQS